MKPIVEILEARFLPAVSLLAGLLSVTVDTLGGLHKVVASPGPNPGDVSLSVDGVPQSFQGVTALDLRGAVLGSNYVENNTPLPATLTGVGNKDTLFGGTGPDTLVAGKGTEILYDLLGVNVVLAKNGRPDRIFTNAASTVATDPGTSLPPGVVVRPPVAARDAVVIFFAANRLPGAGTVIREGSVLYLTPPDTGTTTRLAPVLGGYLLTSNWAGTQFFRGLRSVAYFGGAGSDTFVNNTTLDTVAYGGVGVASDVLVGGFGFNILKGLGGVDALVGRGTVNDLSGSGSSVSDGAVDTLIGLGKLNIFRRGPEDVTVGVGVFVP